MKCRLLYVYIYIYIIYTYMQNSMHIYIYVLYIFWYQTDRELPLFWNKFRTFRTNLFLEKIQNSIRFSSKTSLRLHLQMTKVESLNWNKFSESLNWNKFSNEEVSWYPIPTRNYMYDHVWSSIPWFLCHFKAFLWDSSSKLDAGQRMDLFVQTVRLVCSMRL